MNEVRVLNAHRNYRIARQPIIGTARRVLIGEGVGKSKCSIVFVDDAEILRLNHQFLRHRYVTDVLSFTMSEGGDTLEGEIYVDVDQARRQADELGIPFSEEIRRLVVHGILHLVGHSDATKRAKAGMTALEDYYLNTNRKVYAR